jgi:putative restriction endonuclease
MDELAEFDAPVFKKLAKNDSGQSGANQAGFLIPKELHPYFPPLVRNDDEVAPGVPITAILIVNNEQVGRVETRYQIQTWGGKRKGENRITGNLTELRGQSAQNDILLIERNIVDRSLYRLTLLKPKSEAYKAINGKGDGKRWGPANPMNPPALDAEFDNAERRQAEHEKKELKLFDNTAVITETKARKIARSRAFVRLTTEYYNGRCALCGEGLITGTGRTEIEAAHIVPRHRFGADDARNGLALCRAHHWAFDKGMWGVNAAGDVIVRADVADLAENATLAKFNGAQLIAPNDPDMVPSKEALGWHMENVVNKPTAA